MATRPVALRKHQRARRRDSVFLAFVTHRREVNQRWRQNPWRSESTSELVAAIAATSELVRTAESPGSLGAHGPIIWIDDTVPLESLDIVVAKRSVKTCM